ncbi:MAG: isoleucine--tRNA ligase [Clostridiales bacterium]|nr:isoleucine--tRNA ligase [Clostridiales bacterium]MCF8021332.1 isoleucine--tRNA ligase [Clostridiales bacterium]
MDYSNTLNLPKTKFPMRGNLPQKEPEIINYWKEKDIYHKVKGKNSGKKKFILHDGPPYANGHIHLGHTLNKVLKDIIVKYYSMAGYDAPYVPGWDTHGLPIEQQAIKNLKINRHETDVVEFRNYCKDYAMKFVDIQREEFERLGIRGDWENYYLTLMPNYESRQIGVFGEMAQRNYIYKGLKPVYWCANCETALAEAEVEYNNKKSPSIYVKFEVKKGNDLLPEDNSFVVIWTTTPWTLVANMAVSVHPDFQYVLVEVDEGDYYVLAKELMEQFIEETGLQIKVIKEFTGREMNGVICSNPLMDRDSIVILGEHVTLEAGTGCVHTAPGHGHEDYLVGLEYNLHILSPVDSKGKFTDEGGKYAGQHYTDANKSIINDLYENSSLIKKQNITHQYPHCWRCKKPVFFRATEQWFASIEGFRQQALDAIRNVNWYPAWGEDRIYNMVANRGDWCVSRQRTWGVPIPIFYCNRCNKEIINNNTIAYLQKVFKEYGSDAWFSWDVKDLIPEGLSCPDCGSTEFVKETDIMDVWFDSGSSHLGVLDEEKWPDLCWPADLYLEGSDQHRGWFNSSLSTSVAVTGKPPYKSVLTHGFVVDEDGRKMSKSMGNVIDPLKVIKQRGADILRLWVTSADYRGDLAVSQDILKQISETYRKIRNTVRFMLGNINDFDPSKHLVLGSELREIDRWAMLELNTLIERVQKAYESYEFHVIYHSIHNFCTVDMSARYLDIVKDTLYCQHADSYERRSVQTVLYNVLHALVRMLAPVLTFTSEEIWSHIPRVNGEPESVQMTNMPEVEENLVDPELEEKWHDLLQVRSVVNGALEIARKDKMIGNSLEAAVTLHLSNEMYNFLAPLRQDLAGIFIVSTVQLTMDYAPQGAFSFDELPDVNIVINKAEGEKCQRCWNYQVDVGTDEEYPGVCPRCASVLRKMKYKEV